MERAPEALIHNSGAERKYEELMKSVPTRSLTPAAAARAV